MSAEKFEIGFHQKELPPEYQKIVNELVAKESKSYANWLRLQPASADDFANAT